MWHTKRRDVTKDEDESDRNKVDHNRNMQL